MRSLQNLDARGLIAVACFLLVLAVFGMVLYDRTLLESDAFLILATAVVITGWVQGPVGWAYQATKNGGEMAEGNALLVQNAAAAASSRPQPVQVVQPEGQPIPTMSVDDDQDGLPDYAKL